MEWQHLPSRNVMQDVFDSASTPIYVFAYNVCAASKFPFLQVLLEKTTELDLPPVAVETFDAAEAHCCKYVRAQLPDATRVEWQGIWQCETHDALLGLVAVDGDFSCVATDGKRAKVHFALATELINTEMVGRAPIAPGLCDMVRYNPDLVHLYDPATEQPYSAPDAVFTTTAKKEQSRFQLVFGPSPTREYPLCRDHFYFYRTVERCNPADPYLNRYALFADSLQVAVDSPEEEAFEGKDCLAVYFSDPACTLPDIAVKQFDDFLPLTRYH
jgi:hypothetical protein